MKCLLSAIIFSVAFNVSAAGLGNLINDLTKKPVSPTPAPQAPKPPAPPQQPVKK